MKIWVFDRVLNGVECLSLTLLPLVMKTPHHLLTLFLHKSIYVPFTALMGRGGVPNDSTKLNTVQVFLFESYIGQFRYYSFGNLYLLSVKYK
jgi:hypothetical protein